MTRKKTQISRTKQGQVFSTPIPVVFVHIPPIYKGIRKIWVPAMVEVESLLFPVTAHIPPNTKESKIPATLYIKAFTSPTKITRHPKRDIPKHLADRTTCSFCLHLSADLTVGPPLAVISMTSMTLYSSLSGNVPGNSPLVKHQTWHLQPNLVPTNRKNCKTIHPKPTLSVFKPTPNLFSPASQPAPVAWKVLHSSTFPSPSRPPPLNTASARGRGHVSDAPSRPRSEDRRRPVVCVASRLQLVLIIYMVLVEKRCPKWVGKLIYVSKPGSYIWSIEGLHSPKTEIAAC